MKKLIILLLFPFAACSQSIDFLEPPPANLDVLTNQVLIWDITDASNLTIDGSTNIQQINDKSGNGNHMIPASAGVRPAYSAAGGSNNQAYTTSASGKTLGLTGLSFSSSPLTYYFVLKLPSIPAGGQNIVNIGSTGGTDGIERTVSTSSGDGWRVYTGVNPFFSTITSNPNRTDWMLLKLVIKDNNSFWIEVNDEPTGKYLDTSGSTASTVMNRLLLSNFNGVNVSEVRVFSEEISNISGVNSSKDQTIKDYLIGKYGLTRPSGKKNIILFGDSHSAYVMSGTSTLGPYNVRMQTTMNYNIVLDATSGTVIDPGVGGQGVPNNFEDRHVNYTNAKWNDYYLIINYGTNDSVLRWFGTGLSQANWILAYKAYIQAFLNVGFSPNKIILVTPPYSTAAYIGSVATLNSIRTDIIQIADDLNLHYYDWYGAMVTAGQDCNTVVGGDTIHGDNAIHTTLFDGLTSLLSVL